MIGPNSWEVCWGDTMRCDVGWLHSSLDWTGHISSSTAAVTRLCCAEGISPAVFFWQFRSSGLHLNNPKSFWLTKCRARQHRLYINHTQQQAAEKHPASVWLLLLYTVMRTIKGVFAHQSLWGKFDRLHSPMIGIMELISTCYSVQLVRLPLHPQSSPPSPSSMYDNKHCSSGFPHLLVHISFIPYSYFCGHVCRQENAHVCCAAAASAASAVWIESWGKLDKTFL